MSSTAQSPTVNQVISDIRNDLHSVNLDDWIPAKYIHNKLLDTAKLFIKREGDDRRFQLYPSIWVTIDEFEMIESDLIGCSDISIPYCTKVMKSKLQLPAIYTTRYGYLLNISSVDFNKNYIQTTPRIYSQIKSRRYQNPGLRYFWIYNGYLIIPESMVQSVTLRAVFCKKDEGLKLENCRESGCIKLLDQEFTVPGHLLDDIKSYTIQKIAGIREKILPSEYPHLNQLEKKSPVSK